MKFIKLKELYYHNGNYLTKPLCINIDDIVSVREGKYNYNTKCSIVRIRDGVCYSVEDNHQDIMDKIKEQEALEDDWK